MYIIIYIIIVIIISILMPINQSIIQSINQSIYLFIYLSIHPSIHLSIYLSISIHLSIHAHMHSYLSPYRISIGLLAYSSAKSPSPDRSLATQSYPFVAVTYLVSRSIFIHIWNPYSCSLRFYCSNIFRQFEAYSTYSFYSLSFSLGQTLISQHFCSFQLVKCEPPVTKNPLPRHSLGRGGRQPRKASRVLVLWKMDWSNWEDLEETWGNHGFYQHVFPESVWAQGSSNSGGL